MPRAPLPDGVPPRLWELVSRARRRLLMLDYDGTLAPFRVVRSEARPLPRSMELVRRILTGTRTSVAIVSGRPVNEVERLIGPLPVLLVGEHGWERRLPGGRVVHRRLPAAAVAALDRAERVARDAGWSARLERKRSGVVLHTRGLPAAEARGLERRCARAWRRLARDGAVRVEPIHGGVEMRASGWDKGAVVRALCSRCAPGTLGVFVGDDLTDEDAFAAVREWGFGVRVGGDGRPTSALGHIASCETLPAFLRRWRAATAPGGAAHRAPAVPAGRREHRKRVTRRDLLAAGRRLFGERGLHDVRIADLSRQAGIAKGTLYGYFADREELIEAVVAAGLDELLDRVRRAARGARGHATVLARAADAHLAFFVANPHQMRILHEVRGLLKSDPPEAPRLRRLLARYVGGLAAVLAQGAPRDGAGGLRRQRESAELLFGAVSGIASVRASLAGTPPRSVRSPATVRALVALVVAHEEHAGR